MFYCNGEYIFCDECNSQQSYFPGTDIISYHLAIHKDCESAKKENPRPFVGYDSLKYEEERLATFINWRGYVNPIHLARDGLFYTRFSDRCMCYFCCGTLDGWEPNENVRNKHKLKYPNCPFICGKPVGNVSMVNCNILTSISMGKKPPIVQPTIEKIKYEGEGKCYDIIDHKILYNHYDLSNRLDRLETFRYWPLDKQYINVFVSAGFFYTGVSDHVRCYSCQLGLRNWEMGFNPYEKHISYNPHCSFIKQIASKEEEPDDRDDRYPITKRQLQFFMQNDDIVKYLLSVGFSEQIIQKLYEEKIEKTGVPYLNVQVFVRDSQIHKLNEKEEEEEENNNNLVVDDINFKMQNELVVEQLYKIGFWPRLVKYLYKRYLANEGIIFQDSNTFIKYFEETRINWKDYWRKKNKNYYSNDNLYNSNTIFSTKNEKVILHECVRSSLIEKCKMCLKRNVGVLYNYRNSNDVIISKQLMCIECFKKREMFVYYLLLPCGHDIGENTTTNVECPKCRNIIHKKFVVASYPYRFFNILV